MALGMDYLGYLKSLASALEANVSPYLDKFVNLDQLSTITNEHVIPYFHQSYAILSDVAANFVPYVMQAASTAENFLSYFPTARLPILGCSIFTLLIALNNAYLLRVAVRYPVSWVRLYAILFILTVGGSTVGSMMLGMPSPWILPSSGVVSAITLAFVLMFCTIRGFFLTDLPFRLYGLAIFRPLWTIVTALQHSLAAISGIELLRYATQKTGSAIVSPSPVTMLLIGVVFGCGGGLIVEFTNLLMQHRKNYMHPLGGPSAAFALSFIASILYVFVYTGVPVDLSFMPPLVKPGLIYIRDNFHVPMHPIIKNFVNHPPTFIGLNYEPTAARVRVALIMAVLHLTLGASTLHKIFSAAVKFVLPGFNSVIYPDQPTEKIQAETKSLPWPLSGGLFGYKIFELTEYVPPQPTAAKEKADAKPSAPVKKEPISPPAQQTGKGGKRK